MKTYKLIKEYPGSPKLGSESLESLGYKQADFPEFWEEQKPKEYEILSFISNKDINLLTKGIIVTKQNSGEFTGYTKTFGNTIGDHSTNSVSSTENKFLKSSNWDIHSVKRLSDGEVFTIGDRIRYQNLFCTFTIKFIILLESGQIALKDNSNQVDLENVSKIKIPLFKTEDGVDIFDEDTFVAEVFTQVYSMNSPILFKHTNICLKETKYPTLIFSTEKAAKDYIKLNKPCLSYSDVIEIFKVGKLVSTLSEKYQKEGIASIKTMKTNLNHLIKTRVDGKK